MLSPKKMKVIFFGVLSRTKMRHKYIQITMCPNQNTWDCDVDTFVLGKCIYLVRWSCYLVCFDLQHTAFFLINHHQFYKRRDALLLFETCRLLKFQIMHIPLNSCCLLSICTLHWDITISCSPFPIPHSPFPMQPQSWCWLLCFSKTILPILWLQPMPMLLLFKAIFVVPFMSMVTVPEFVVRFSYHDYRRRCCT